MKKIYDIIIATIKELYIELLVGIIALFIREQFEKNIFQFISVALTVVALACVSKKIGGFLWRKLKQWNRTRKIKSLRLAEVTTDMYIKEKEDNNTKVNNYSIGCFAREYRIGPYHQNINRADLYLEYNIDAHNDTDAPINKIYLTLSIRKSTITEFKAQVTYYQFPSKQHSLTTDLMPSLEDSGDRILFFEIPTPNAGIPRNAQFFYKIWLKQTGGFSCDSNVLLIDPSKHTKGKVCDSIVNFKIVEDREILGSILKRGKFILEETSYASYPERTEMHNLKLKKYSFKTRLPDMSKLYRLKFYHGNNSNESSEVTKDCAPK